MPAPAPPDEGAAEPAAPAREARDAATAASSPPEPALHVELRRVRPEASSVATATPTGAVSMVPFVEALAPQIGPEGNGSAVALAAPEATALRERVARPVELPGESWPSTATLAGIAFAVAGAAIVLVAVALALQVRGDGGTDSSAADAETRRTLALLSKPSTERIPLEGTKGAIVLAVGTGGLAALVLDDLAPVPAGKAFEAWVVDPAGGPPSPAAVFSDEEKVVLLSRPVPAGATVGVTVETAVGVDAPTQRLRLVATRAR